MLAKLTVAIVAAFVVAALPPTQAQQQAKVPKIGWLGVSPSAPGSGYEFISRELRALGYVERTSIAFEYRFADNKVARLPALADELIRLQVDVLLVPTMPSALAAKNATRTIPIVLVSVPDPVAFGLVDSLARPGGNITGFTNISAVLSGKRLELLKETVPKLSRAAVLWDPLAPGSEQQWKESQLAGRELRVQLHSMRVSSADKYDAEFNEAIKARSSALAVTQHPLATTNQNKIAELAIKNRLPAIYPRSDFVASSGLMSYGPDRAEPFRRVASMIDKILKGTKPADIPVEQPMRFEFVVNLKTAKQIGLTIPPEVLARANRIIR